MSRCLLPSIFPTAKSSAGRRSIRVTAASRSRSSRALIRYLRSGNSPLANGTAPVMGCWVRRDFHYFVSHPAEEEGIGLVEVLDRVTMQVFVRGYCTMIAAPVQRHVHGIPKGPRHAMQSQLRQAARFADFM